MSENTAELQVLTSPTPESITKRLKTWSGEKTLNPGALGLSAETGKRVPKQFEEKALSETDIVTLVDGVIPAESIFNPDIPLNQITTQSGPVKLERIGRARQAIGNTILKFLKLNTAAASYEPSNKRIKVVAKLDGFSTVVAIAKGDFSGIVGPEIAHESLHAHQDIERQPMDQTQAAESLRRALTIQKTDSGLSLTEAIQLEGKSRDLAIITETQAYLLQFMLTGGNIPSDTIKVLKFALAQSGSTETGQLQINNILLSRYSENGFASIDDMVIDNVRTYLPKKDQDNEDYLNRIRSATLQMIRLLNQGVSHRQIADLIRSNHQSIQNSTEWDETTHNYKFLRLERSSQDGAQIDDESLLIRFNKQTEERVTKLKQIAIGVLTQRQ
jgi:hypothetical protein